MLGVRSAYAGSACMGVLLYMQSNICNVPVLYCTTLLYCTVYTVQYT
jgi:hypothetical protein